MRIKQTVTVRITKEARDKIKKLAKFKGMTIVEYVDRFIVGLKFDKLLK